jgi:hypothetical protein
VHHGKTGPSMSAFGSKADIAVPLTNVRFTPKSGHWNSAVKCPLCAKSRTTFATVRQKGMDETFRSFLLIVAINRPSEHNQSLGTDKQDPLRTDAR